LPIPQVVLIFRNVSLMLILLPTLGAVIINGNIFRKSSRLEKSKSRAGGWELSEKAALGGVTRSFGGINNLFDFHGKLGARFVLGWEGFVLKFREGSCRVSVVSHVRWWARLFSEVL
jgi:hypothetical protein